MLDKTLTIGIPTYGQVDPSFAVQLRLLQIPFKKYEVLNPQNMIIDEARNFIVDKMIGDYLFFLDSDVIPPVDVIPRLLAHLEGSDKAIASGLYFTKTQPFYPVIFKESDLPGTYDTKLFYEKNKLIEIASAGLGCCLIKREVFDAIGTQEEDKPIPWFKFTTGWSDKQRESEDHYFFRLCREAGYKVYCDTSLTCGHIGPIAVLEGFWEQMRKDMYPTTKPIIKNTMK